MIAVPEATTISETLPPDPALELTNDLGRKPMRERRKCPFEDDAHHFPMTGHRVLARGHFSHAAEGACGRRRIAADRGRARQAERSQRGNFQADGLCYVAERVGAFVVIEMGIGQLARADRIHDDENRTRKHGNWITD
jgi:hypothetical protein